MTTQMVWLGSSSGSVHTRQCQIGLAIATSFDKSDALRLDDLENLRSIFVSPFPSDGQLFRHHSWDRETTAAAAARVPLVSPRLPRARTPARRIFVGCSMSFRSILKLRQKFSPCHYTILPFILHPFPSIPSFPCFPIFNLPFT